MIKVFNWANKLQGLTLIKIIFSWLAPAIFLIVQFINCLFILHAHYPGNSHHSSGYDDRRCYSATRHRGNKTRLLI